MEASGIITLTTDFGYSDNYVGQMKGAIFAVNPEVRIVVSHDPQQREAMSRDGWIGPRFE